jgi:hypothetical protein
VQTFFYHVLKYAFKENSLPLYVRILHAVDRLVQLGQKGGKGCLEGYPEILLSKETTRVIDGEDEA